jgi:hypothetical protein
MRDKETKKKEDKRRIFISQRNTNEKLNRQNETNRNMKLNIMTRKIGKRML